MEKSAIIGLYIIGKQYRIDESHPNTSLVRLEWVGKYNITCIVSNEEGEQWATQLSRLTDPT